MLAPISLLPSLLWLLLLLASPLLSLLLRVLFYRGAARVRCSPLSEPHVSSALLSASSSWIKKGA